MTDSQRISRLANTVPPFHVMALLERAQQLAAQGRDIIHLEVGEPDFPCPSPVMAAARHALDLGQTRYTPAAGLPALREIIAEDYRDRFGAQVDPARIVVTPGASGALQLALGALLDPGDGVLLCDPGYPCNRQFVRMFGGMPQPMPLQASTGFRPSGDILRSAWDETTRAALVASPDNPTGNRIPAGELNDWARWCRERQGTLIVDEIYQGLCYGAEAETVLAHGDAAWVINSFSKYFGMTGWRLGWVVAPPALVPDLDRMAQNFFLSPSAPAQYAALAAFQPDTLAELERRRQVLAERRACLLEKLPAMGLKVVGNPAGAFYLYLDVSAITDDSYAFSRALLEQAHVALTPGVDFGPGHQPSRYLRVAYTCDLPRLEEALVRLSRFMETL